jgi:phosphohistidine phosphatase SixA
MKLILIRHAERCHDVNEVEAPLTDNGRKKASETSAALRDANVTPNIVLSSKQEPSKETARLISPHVESVPTDLLSPGNEDPRWSVLSAKLNHPDGQIPDDAIVAIVGHHPAIANLLRSVTGHKNLRRIGFGEAIVVEGSEADMECGRGNVVKVVGADDASESLRKKIELKMTVCTFLAGFTIPVLVELLKDPPADLLRVLSAVAFACSLALLVAAIFIFDLLLMPNNFWGPINADMKPKRSRRQFSLDFRLNGALYAYMVRTWSWFFIGALIFVFAGVLLLVVNGFTETRLDRRGATIVLLTGIIIAVGGTAILHRILRPRLGIED